MENNMTPTRGRVNLKNNDWENGDRKSGDFIVKFVNRWDRSVEAKWVSPKRENYILRS
jgi:hypothetical protein